MKYDGRPVDRVTFRQIPVMPPLRTIIDLYERTVKRALRQAKFSDDELRQLPRGGMLGRILDLSAAPTASENEDFLLDLVPPSRRSGAIRRRCSSPGSKPPARRFKPAPSELQAASRKLLGMQVSSPTELTWLRARLAGTLALPGEPGYELATPWNVAVPMTPAGVVVAANANDVAETVRFANANGLRVLPQRTGHGAVAMDLDDVLLVHTGKLDELTIDAANRRARIGAGVVLQQVLDAAAPHGLGPVVGSAPGVGVAGFLTGGGIGPLVRTFGAASDTVLAFEVVTGDGRHVRVTPDEHADLFWGLRGGKNTLGIVTAVEIELLDLTTVHGGAIYFNGTATSGVLHVWREWAPTLPEHANTSIALLQLPPLPGVPEPLAGRFTVAVRFTSTASAEACDALLQPMRDAAPALIDTIGTLPYAAIGAVHADPVDPMPVLETSGLLSELSTDTVDALIEAAGPDASSRQVIVELRLLGGALARVPEHKSALCHRDAAFSLLVIGVPGPGVAEHNAVVQHALHPWLTGRELPNFGAAAGEQRMARVYDEDTRTWLSALAERHDPKGVLRVGQTARS